MFYFTRLFLLRRHPHLLFKAFPAAFFSDFFQVGLPLFHATHLHKKPRVLRLLNAHVRENAHIQTSAHTNEHTYKQAHTNEHTYKQAHTNEHTYKQAHTNEHILTSTY